MTYTVKITERAWEHLKKAAINYEDFQTGLGQEFLEAFRETADWISLNPRMYAVKFDNIRSVRIKHFKKEKTKRAFRHILLYEVFGDQIPIYAVIGINTQDSDPESWVKFRR